MQLRTTNGYGTVSIITTPTNRIIGDALADWTEVVEGTSWFSLIGDPNVWFNIQTKTAPGVSVSGFWEVTLAANYVGAIVSGASYAIEKDHTNLHNLPLLDPGDVQRSQSWNRAMQIIDGIIGGGGDLLILSLAIATLTLPKPSLKAMIATVDGTEVVQWWLLQTGAPTGTDTATIDDGTSRWRRVG